MATEDGDDGRSKAGIDFGLTLPLQGFTLDYTELREYTHGTLCDVADLLKEDFSPYLSDAVRFAFASLAQVVHDQIWGQQPPQGFAKNR